jgi:hypothetical protein
MGADPFHLVLAAAAETDDVILSREAMRLGLSRRTLETFRAAAGQPLVRGAVAIPPVRNPLRTAVRGAQLAVPAGVISHASAAHVHGLQGLGFWSPYQPVDLTLPRQWTRRQRSGARLHFRDVPDDFVVTQGGLRLTSVVRTLADCAALLDRTAFVSIVDSAINRGRFPAEDLPLLAELVRAYRLSFAVSWLLLVDGRSESPSETVTRLVLTDAGLPPDDLQLLVRDDDGFPVARLDMAYRRGRRRVGVEVDSGEHDRVRALYRDRDKHNALRGLGWDVRQVTARDSHRRPQYVVVQVRDALGLPE